MEINPSRLALYMHLYEVDSIIKPLMDQVGFPDDGDYSDVSDFEVKADLLIELFEFMARHQLLRLENNELYLIMRDDLHRARGIKEFTPATLFHTMEGRCQRSSAIKGMRGVYNNPANRRMREIESRQK